jgi:uncharacterized membrane protein YcaP (DUF421 family)
MFFQSWSSLLRIAVVGALAYVGLVALLRISGNRTLAKLNAFDLVVTVALGSTLATVLLNSSVALADGVFAFALLIGLQYVVAWASVRSDRISATVKSTPVLLLHRGRLLERTLLAARVTPAEVRAAIRNGGYAGAEDIAAVVLETDGSLTVIPEAHATATSSALKDVRSREEGV